MKLVKSLLLGSAAGFVAIAGASAADLPSRKAAPAEYVKVCSAYGAGFFYIPGTDVCLKVGGQARLDVYYAEPFGTGAAPMGFRAQGRVELDARNPTAYGTLRAFVRLDFASRTGAARSGTQERWGNAIPANVAARGSAAANADAGWQGQAQTWVQIDKAFVQWGGLIAGRAASLFDFNKSPEMIGLIPTSSYGSTNLLGYIATFGSGFYASVSAEDSQMRRMALTDPFNPAGTVNYYSGQRMPDIVANIGVEQSWGSAQISAAVHQIPVISTAAMGTPNIESKYGWAVNGGVLINLPMLAPGDNLWLNAAYSEGASSYTQSNWTGSAINSTGVGNSHAYYQADAYINPVTGAISKSKAWSVVGSFTHYWAPTLRSSVFAGYTNFKNPTVAGVNIADWDYWAAGGNLIWSPVRALDIGVEVAYNKIKGRGFTVTPAGALVAGTVQGVGLKTSDGSWNARFRVSRSF